VREGFITTEQEMLTIVWVHDLYLSLQKCSEVSEKNDHEIESKKTLGEK
jgi:hypothetical protein